MKLSLQHGPIQLTSILSACLACVADASAAAQRTAPPPGLRENTPAVHALVGARIVVSPEQVIEKGTLVVRDGVIVAVGADVATPPDVRVWDVRGKTLYPGFIDAYSELTGDAAKTSAGDTGGAGYWNANITPQFRADRHYAADAEANKKLRGQGITARLVAPSAGIIKGTSALVTTADDGGEQSILKDRVALHMKLTVSRGSGRAGGYPNSPMGALTLARQALFDAGWYGQAWDAFARNPGLERPERSDALAALRGYLGGKAPVIIDAGDELYFFRANAIANEFGLQAIVRGSGDEYRRLQAVAATHRPVIVPLNFPRPPKVSPPEAAMNVSLERLMHWDLAPDNPARLAEAGVQIAFTTYGLRDSGTFLAAIRKAVKRGLRPEAALRALTVAPAEWFGASRRLGTLAAGKAANIVVTDGDLFDAKTKVLETWVDGARFEIEAAPLLDVRGTWELQLTKADGTIDTLVMQLTGQPSKLSGKLKRGEMESNFTRVVIDDAQLAAAIKGQPLGYDGVVQLSGAVSTGPVSKEAESNDVAAKEPPKPGEAAGGEMSWLGVVVWADGTRAAASAKRTDAKVPPAPPAPAQRRPRSGRGRPDSTKPDANKPEALARDDKPDTKATEDHKDDTEKAADEKGAHEKGAGDKSAPATDAKPKDAASNRALFAVNYPLGDLGVAQPPEQPKAVVFRNATVWTSGPRGTLESASVLVEAGKITAVGEKLTAPEGAMVIDLAGKHLSPGVIDCHSHIATDGGVNESGQTITAEVRIGDFIDSNDINIYRQLAGGVTTSNILHGSANTIGGQNQVLKFRWGALPEEMKFANAPPGIKFALGENVKQSNRGEGSSNRYPQSRMGVEQLVRDAFSAALDYRRRWDQWQRQKTGLPPRVDLELEALSEVLAGKRLVHCHSYRQDEILALLRTCEDFGVKIATLQHILEGYKVADVMAKHGVGGSTFSDWWAYKFEVYDAIPYNGALLHNAGVVVSFNSDDAELARRLNLEAGKAVKYGGVPPVEALKFVTLNPARQLGIDRWVGSIEVGKDADLVVWSGPPMSTYSRCEQTWIDGRRYFDRAEDQKRRQENAKMHAALVQRILASGEASEGPDDNRRDRWPREDIFCGHDHGDVLFHLRQHIDE
jgi:imidazolonepropionase-like amidohydrolase